MSVRINDGRGEIGGELTGEGEREGRVGLGEGLVLEHVREIVEGCFIPESDLPEDSGNGGMKEDRSEGLHVGVVVVTSAPGVPAGARKDFLHREHCVGGLRNWDMKRCKGVKTLDCGGCRLRTVVK